MGTRARSRLLIPLILGAAAAVLATATVASATARSQPTGGAAPNGPVNYDNAPIGGTVPGLTGSAAQQGAGAAGERFGQLAAARNSRLKAAAAAGVANAAVDSGAAAAAAAQAHVTWGFTLPNSKGQGLRATHTVFTGAGATTHTNDVTYAPTALAPGGACMEMTTAYTDTGPVLWAWNWCAGFDGVGKLVKIDSSFLSTYTTTLNGYAAYTMDVHKTNASTNEWTAYLFNYQTQAWDVFYVSSGTFDLTGYTFGWDIFEVYATTDPSTGNAYFCASQNGRKFEAANLQEQVNGAWTAVTSAMANVDSIPNFGCPTLSLSVVHPNDHWLAQIGNVTPPTTTPPTTRPPTTAPPTTRPPTTPPTTTRPPTTPPTTSRPPTTTATSGSGCAATYQVVGSWQGGFQGQITVANTGSTAISGWTVRFTFANGQVISQIWGGTLTQSGASVTIGNVSYNGALAAGASTTAGFLASWNATNSIPAVSCTAS
jgi:hypothetical protein